MAELVRSKLVKDLLAEVEGILSNPDLTPLSKLYYEKTKALLLSYKSTPKDKKEGVFKSAKDSKELADRITLLEQSISSPELPAEVVSIYRQAQDALIASNKDLYEKKLKEAQAEEKSFRKAIPSKRVVQLRERIEKLKHDSPEEKEKIESLEKLLQNLDPISGRQRIEKDVEPFVAFLVPLVKMAQDKMTKYPLADRADLISSLRDIQKVVGSVSSEGIKEIRRDFNSIEKDSYELTQEKLKEEKKANEDFENRRNLFLKDSDNKKEEVIAKALELSFAEDSKDNSEESDEEELDEERGVLGSKKIPLWAEEELKSLEQSTKIQLEEMQVDLTKFLYAIREADRQKREELDKRRIALLEKTQEVFTDLVLSTPELVEKIQVLQEKIERFPEKLKKRDATPIDIKFINSVSTLHFKEEKEKLLLKLKERKAEPKKDVSMAERLEKLIAKKAIKKSEDKVLRDYDVEDRKENIEREEDEVGEYDVDFANDEQEVIANEADEDFEFAEDEEFVQDDSEDEEEEVLDSEDEEEDGDEKENHIQRRMKRYLNLIPAKVFPLTEGEKILQKIPGIMNLPEKVYKEIQQEISTLSTEIDTIYDIYSQLLSKSVKPLLSTLSTFPKFKSEDYLYTLFLINYSGKPVNWHTNWNSAFSFTDEQRFVAIMSTSDNKVAEALKTRLKKVINEDYASSQQTIFSKADGNYITHVLEPLSGNPAEWLERNYDLYLPYIPRIIAKLLVIARTIGSSATRWLGTPEQILLIDEYTKTRDVLSKEELSELMDLMVGYSETSKLSVVKSLVAKMLSHMKVKNSMTIYEVREMIEKAEDYAVKSNVKEIKELAESMRQYTNEKGVINLPEVKELAEKMTALDITDKLLYGIPVLPLISPTAYVSMADLIVKLRSLTRTKIEEKSDYPFVVSFEKLAEYIPSLLINIFINNRSRISNTRQTYLKKYLLSRLDVEQYIYVKTFMNHPETKDLFSDIIESLRSAHHYAILVESKAITLSDLEKELPNDLFDIVIQAVDHSFYLKVNRIFTKKKTLKEYKEAYEKLVPVSKELAKCEFAFLSNCQYTFRDRYSLSFPVVAGTVEDLIAIDEIAQTLPFDNDGFFEKVNLSKLQEKLSGDYQKDLLAAVLDSKLSLFISLKCRETLSSALQGTTIRRISVLKYNPAVDYKEDGKLLSNDIILNMLTYLDEKVSGMLKNRNTDFSGVDQIYRKELAEILYVIEKTRPDFEIPQEFEPYKDSFTPPPAQNLMKKVLTKYRKQKRSFPEGHKIVDRTAYSISEIEAQIAEMNKSSLEDIRREIGAKNFFPAYYEQFYNIVVHKIKADRERGVENSLDSYLKLYQELMSSIPIEFQLKNLPAVAEQDGFFIRAIFPNLEEIKERLSGYMRKVRQFDHFVKQKFLQPKTIFPYKPEDAKMVSIHPELMGILPHIVLYNTTFSLEGERIRDDVPMEFIRGYVSEKISVSDQKLQSLKEVGLVPVKPKKWVYPSILFFQELMDKEIEVENILLSFGKMVEDEMDVIIVRGKAYLLGIERNKMVKEAGRVDLLDIVQKLELRKVVDVLHSELVVLPSVVDKTMVIDIASDSIFYPGYTKYLSGKESGPGIPASTVVDKQLKELLRLQEVQKDAFVRHNELERLQLKKKLLEGGWKRATIHLIREMERIGVSGLESISVGSIEYKCGLIQNNKLIEVDHDTLLQTIYDFVQTQGSEMRIKKELLKFVEEPEEEPEEEQKYEGTKEKKCLVCDKPIKGKPWFNSVVFDEGKARVVEICSEKCSEMYKPYK